MLIAVAGPYSAESELQKAANLKKINAAAAEVYRKGHIPVIRVNASLFIADEFPVLERKKIISDISYAIVKRCDAILMVGSSHGADIERKIIEEKGLPVYYSIDGIPEVK